MHCSFPRQTLAQQTSDSGPRAGIFRSWLSSRVPVGPRSGCPRPLSAALSPGRSGAVKNPQAMTCPWGQLSATGAEGERGAAGCRVAGPGVRMAGFETGPLTFTNRVLSLLPRTCALNHLSLLSELSLPATYSEAALTLQGCLLRPEEESKRGDGPGGQSTHRGAQGCTHPPLPVCVYACPRKCVCVMCARACVCETRPSGSGGRRLPHQVSYTQL